jgi:hypothetical protein
VPVTLPIRRMLACALLATLVVGPGALAAKRAPDTRLRVGKGIGAAHVGMTAAKVAKVLHTRPTKAVTRQNPEGRYRVKRAGVLVVSYDPDTLRAVLVQTKSRRFHYRGLHVGSSRATVLKRLAGKRWRHLTCRGTEYEVAYYPGKALDSPVGRVPTARAQLDLGGHQRVQEMSAGDDVQVISSSQCDDAGL